MANVVASQFIDWQAVAGIAALLAAPSWVIAYFSYRWARKESRLKSLTEILHPYVRAMQHLNIANNCRRTCEQMKRSFPDPERERQAAQRVKSEMAEYRRLIEAASEECKTLERELATRQFRFPDRITSILKASKHDLFETGRLVNDGLFSQADVYLAKLNDHYKHIATYARGWRLADPVEWFRLRLDRVRKKKEPEPSGPALSEDEMQQILDLVHKRLTIQDGHSFAVHPPKKLIEHPEIAQGDDVIRQLENSVFEVVFQDGTYKLMSLVELMVFAYQLVFLGQQRVRVEQIAGAFVEQPVQINLSLRFTIGDIMRPEVVKVLLSQINFSDSPSDAPQERTQHQAENAP